MKSLAARLLASRLLAARLLAARLLAARLLASRLLAARLLAAPMLMVVACSSPTGSTCPTTDPPTSASFGQQFFTDYCIGCHSKTATNRHGAPGDQNYDTEDQIRAHADDIDSEAASGPDATNTDMPDLSGPVHNPPSVEERKLLGEYLACLKGQ